MTVKELIDRLKAFPDQNEITLMSGGLDKPSLVVISGKEGELLENRKLTYISGF